jgi:putative transposase
MSHTSHRLLYHFVWTTWNREPLLSDQVEGRAHAAIRMHCGQMNVMVNAIGGTSDHVHLLATLPLSMCIEEFLRSVKDASLKALQRTYGSGITAFRWQLGFGVYTVSPSHRSKVRDYIVAQKELHASGDLWKGCEPKAGRVPVETESGA